MVLYYSYRYSRSGIRLPSHVRDIHLRIYYGQRLQTKSEYVIRISNLIPVLFANIGTVLSDEQLNQLCKSTSDFNLHQRSYPFRFSSGFNHIHIYLSVLVSHSLQSSNGLFTVCSILSNSLEHHISLATSH